MSASKVDLKSLDVIHNQGLRLSLGAFKSSPVESLYAEAFELPLHERRFQAAMKYALKIKSHPDNAAYQTIFKPKFRHLFEDEQITDPFGIFVQKELSEADIDTSKILINKIPDIPVWDSKSIAVDFELAQFDKSSTNPYIFQSKFLEILYTRYKDYYHIYTDGSKFNEKASSGVYASDITKSFRISDDSSIYTAELEAIKSALEMVKSSQHGDNVIFSDAKSVLQSLQNQESKNQVVNETLHSIQVLLKAGKNVQFCWIPSHVGIIGNEKADTEAKAG